MRNIVTFFIAVLYCFHASAQNCCTKPTGMHALAMNAEFRASHLAPLPLDYTPERGSMIKFKTNGNDGNAFYIPSDGSTNKVLLVFHEWWGLNDYIKREAENWQKELGPGVAVYAVDLYDGKVASTPEEAGRFMGDLDANRGEAIINGLLQRIGTDKKIATLGWCMGGTWSFTASVLAGTQAAGCVMYYGFPEKNPNRIKQLKADVLYIRGSQDNFIKESEVLELEKRVQKYGHNFTMYSFDAVHAFANPSNPKYDAAATADAKKYSSQFLKQKLSIQ